MNYNDRNKDRSLDDGMLVSQRTLAARWKKSTRTLQRWRAERYGPAWLLIGGSVLYREVDILAFESRMRRGGEADQ